MRRKILLIALTISVFSCQQSYCAPQYTNPTSPVTGNIQNNTADQGAGIYNSMNTGTVYVHDAVFSYNTSTNTSSYGGGGAIYNGISSNIGMYITNSEFSSNTAAGYGGAILNASNGIMYIDNSSFNNNNAGTNGGAIANLGKLHIENSTIGGNGNTSSIFNNGDIVIKNSTISNGNGTNGGGISTMGGSYTTIIDSSISGNHASGYGGAIYNLAHLNIIADNNDIIFQNNYSSWDGSSGIANDIFNGAGEINLNASEGKTITFNSGIIGTDPSVSTPQRGDDSYSININKAFSFNDVTVNANTVSPTTRNQQTGTGEIIFNGPVADSVKVWNGTLSNYNTLSGDINTTGAGSLFNNGSESNNSNANVTGTVLFRDGSTGYNHGTISGNIYVGSTYSDSAQSTLNNKGTISGEVHNNGGIINNTGTMSGNIYNYNNNGFSETAKIVSSADGLGSNGTYLQNDGILEITGGTTQTDITPGYSGGTVTVKTENDVFTVNKDIRGQIIRLENGTMKIDQSGGLNANRIAQTGTQLYAKGGTLSTQDGIIAGVNMGNVNLSENDLYLAIDANLTTANPGIGADVLSANNITGPNNMLINNIYLINDDADKIYNDVLVAGSGVQGQGKLGIANNVEIQNNANVGGLSVSYNDTTGYMNLAYTTLKDAVNSTVNEKIYALGGDEDVRQHLGTLNGATVSPTYMTISGGNNSGNNYAIIGNGNNNGEQVDGIEISNNNQKLFVNNIRTWDNFTTAVDNTVGADMEFKNVNFGTNNTVAVKNNGALTLKGNNSFDSAVQGTGSTTVNDGSTNVMASFVQNSLTVKNGAALNNGSSSVTTPEITVTTMNIGDNSASTTAQLNNYGSISATTLNNNANGNILNYGSINGGVVNGAGAQINNHGTFTGTVSNNSTANIYNFNGGNIQSTVTNSGIITNGNETNTTALISGNIISNSGNITNRGNITGGIGNIDSEGTIIGSNTSNVNNYGSISSASVYNSNNITNFSGGSISADAFNFGTVTNNSGATISGNINNNGVSTANTATVNNEGLISGNIYNNAYGVINNSNSVTGDVVNNLNGAVYNGTSSNHTASMTGNVTNSSTSFHNYGVLGESEKLTSNLTEGLITNYSGANITGSLSNAGTITNNSGALISAITTNNNLVTNNFGGTISNQFTNEGTDSSNIAYLQNSGSVSGNIINNAYGTVNNNNSISGTVTNNNNGIINNGTASNHTSTITGNVTNNSGGVVNNYAKLGTSSSTLTNNFGGIINNNTNADNIAITTNKGNFYNKNGATVSGQFSNTSDSLSNFAYLENNGNVTGNIINGLNSSIVNNNSISSASVQNNGTFRNNYNVSNGNFNNLTEGNLNNYGQIASSVTNAGIINNHEDAVVLGNVENSGIINNNYTRTDNGDGTFTITSGRITGNINNLSGGTISSFADYLEGTTANAGTINLLGGRTANDITGYNNSTTGVINIANDVILANAVNDNTINLTGGTAYLRNTDYRGSTINADGGNINLINGIAEETWLKGFNINNNDVDIAIDLDLSTMTTDRFTNPDAVDGKTITSQGEGIAHITNVNQYYSKVDANGNGILYDKKVDKDLNQMLGLDNVTLSKDDPDIDLGITETSTRRLRGSIHNGRLVYIPIGFNYSTFAAQIASQLGGYTTQLNSYDEAFRNLDTYMLSTRAQRQAMKNRNRYAIADITKPLYRQNGFYDRRGAWFRPYATFENVPLRHGPHVSNVSYGAFFGEDSPLRELKNGWDGIGGVYIGYNGSHQSYHGIGMYQNGGTFGLSGMLFKDNFFLGGTVNISGNIGEASTEYGHEDYKMLMTGAATKFGYNIELNDGKFIIQPNMIASYSLVNTFNYTNAAGVRIKSDALHAIQLAPGIQFIGNPGNGWQPYAGINMVWNILDKTDFRANDLSLPGMSIKPYVKYGLGIKKEWDDSFAGFLQAYVTNGGRNGVGLQTGLKWAVGE